MKKCHLVAVFFLLCNTIPLQSYTLTQVARAKFF